MTLPEGERPNKSKKSKIKKEYMYFKKQNTP